MNVVFWFLVIAAAVLVWFLLSFAFKGIGGFFLRLFHDAKNEILTEETMDKKESEDDSHEKR